MDRSFWMRACVVALAWIGVAAPASADDDLIGAPGRYVSAYSDTLLDIGVTHSLGYVELRAANPDVDPWLPGEGTSIVLPTQHLLPNAPRRGIVINLAELRLYYFPAGGPAQTYPIGIGREGKETPLGRTRVVRKKRDPTWVPTKSEHEENPDLPAAVGPGPDNPMGAYALYLGWPGYAVHGTNKVYSIGRRGTHGCIRLYPDDIRALFAQVSPGVPVTVVDQPAKVGWSDGELFLEVHPLQEDADGLEQDGAPWSPMPIDADFLVAAAAGREILRVDWDAVHAAELRRDGIPVQVTAARNPNTD
jgi:L,D-transpeptidase ErfK/SrfK